MPAKRQASVVKEKERKKLDMKIEIEDFGPISSGKITLKPLTVFIGPNNSGKSYAAMLIHSLFESYYGATSRWFSVLDHLHVGEMDRLTKQLLGVQNQLGNEKKALELPRQSVETMTELALAALYEGVLSDKIARSFACPLNELIKIGKVSFALEVIYDSRSIHLACSEGKLEIRHCTQLDVQLDDTRMRFAATIAENTYEELMTHLLNLIPGIYSKALEHVAIDCHYLPAARSGILQGHKTLAANVMRQIPYVGIRDLEIPRLSGVVSDFISSIIDLPEERGPLYQLAKDFEEQLIQGEIIVPRKGEHLYPEIKYRFGDTEIPLHRSSSTVSELAPLFLYLKYKVKPKSILMIEEPEAHLHPRNQRILARLLVRLVRGGVNVIITTHSEYLLEQLRNFVLLSKVEPEKRVEKYKYSEEDYLEPDEFAAYLFHYDKKSKGHRIDRVKMTKDGEFSQDEFVNVIDALYEETIRLRVDLSDET